MPTKESRDSPEPSLEQFVFNKIQEALGARQKALDNILNRKDIESTRGLTKFPILKMKLDNIIEENNKRMADGSNISEAEVKKLIDDLDEIIASLKRIKK